MASGSTTVRQVQLAVNRRLLVDCRERSKRHEVVRARQLAILLCYLRLKITYEDLARSFGIDQSTVGYALARAEKAVKRDRGLQEMLRDVALEVFGPTPQQLAERINELEKRVRRLEDRA